MPDLSHLWQRFLLAMALLAGLAIGVGATVFGYSNLNTIDIHWSVVRLPGVPVWAAVLVPITLLLIAGTVFHWLDGLHHFSEHMRHRRRVHELEAEVARLKAHLDQVLEMPRGEAVKAEAATPSLPPADLAAIDAGMPPDAEPPKAAKTKRAKLLPDTADALKPAGNGAAAAEPVAAAAGTETSTTTDAPNDAG